MTQITVNVIKSVVRNGIAHLEIQLGQRKLVAEVTADKVDTPEKLADWLIRQPLPPETVNTTIRQRLTIEFHNEDFLDEDGETRPVRVLDEVTVEPLPEEKALVDIEAIPDWATWNSTQAQAWIESNVTNLNTAKTAIKALAVMVILLRDAVIGLRRRVE